ncbi:universal stress protein [Streptomyces sp. NPDC017993]|uniref:universal stress protein n=1 Tax=Streptomyces sp. NPDC017993 TaxID=3365027 RepID=UPI0037AC7586
MDTRPIIVGVDGTVDSERALHWAVEAARLRSAPLQVVHIRPYATSSRAAAAEEGTGDPVLDALRADPAAQSLAEVEFRGLSGLTEALLPALGDEGQLLVLGSRGRGGFAGLLLGSNGLACAARAACPVVVVPRPDRGGGRVGADRDGRQVTLGVEVSAEEPGAIGFAFAEASRRGARLKVVSGYTWPMLLPDSFEYVAAHETTQQEHEDALGIQLVDALAPHRARHPAVDVEVQLRNADAAGQLVEASHASDLVVVARHARRRPVGRRLGSVAHAVLLHALCPVAVVPDIARTDGGQGPPIV